MGVKSNNIREALKEELQQLPDSLLQELKDYMEFLQYRHSTATVTAKSGEKKLDKWKKDILDLPKWEEKDLAVFEESRKFFNQWNVQEW